MLIIAFNRCHPENSPEGTVCKDESEINDFIRGKYLTLLSNEIRFDSEQKGLSAIIKESTLTWYPVSYQMQLRYPHQISMSKLFSQDEAVNMDDLTEMENGEIFRLTRLPQIPAENHPWQQMEISVEMNLDVTKVNRSYYSLLDCLSDIGGILQCLLTGIAFSLVILNYQHMDNYLASILFRVK